MKPVRPRTKILLEMLDVLERPEGQRLGDLHFRGVQAGCHNVYQFVDTTIS